MRTVYSRSVIFRAAGLLSLTFIQALNFYATPDKYAPWGWMNRSMNFYFLTLHLDRRLPETRSQCRFSISWLSVCLSVTYDFKFYPRRSLEDNWNRMISVEPFISSWRIDHCEKLVSRYPCLGSLMIRKIPYLTVPTSCQSIRLHGALSVEQQHRWTNVITSILTLQFTTIT